VGGDGGVVARDAVCGPADGARDVERRARLVGARPPRRRARRVGALERERQPAVRERRRVEPVAQRRRERARRRRDLGEELEGVQRAGGLAGGAAEVGLERPAEAAVGVPVGGERGQHPLPVAVSEEEIEPAAVDHPRVGVHER
jgi:hypothetical protein